MPRLVSIRVKDFLNKFFCTIRESIRIGPRPPSRPACVLFVQFERGAIVRDTRRFCVLDLCHSVSHGARASPSTLAREPKSLLLNK